MDLTHIAYVQLSKDDDRYQEKLAAFQEAGFCTIRSKTSGSTQNLFSKERRSICSFSERKGFTSTVRRLASGKCCSSYWRVALNMTSQATAGSGRKTEPATAESVNFPTTPGISIPGRGRESPAIFFGDSHEKNHSK